MRWCTVWRVEALRCAKVSALNASADHTPGTYAYYYIDFSPYSWSPGDGQSATMDIDFEVELFAAGSQARKYMIVRAKGTGVNPGSLAVDDIDERGWFQQRLNFEIEPLGGPLSSYAHQPTTTNRSSSFTVTNGITLSSGADPSGPNTSIGFNYSEAANRYLEDFGVVDQSSGNQLAWSFEMTAADGHPYDAWADLVNDWTGFLYGLPALATSNLFTDFEGVYSAPADYRGRPQVQFRYSQKLRKTWVDWYVVVYAPHTSAATQSRWWDYSIDFGRVHVPSQGTVPFVEQWTTNSFTPTWQVKDEGSTGTPTWTANLGSVLQTGSTRSADGTRGTWLWAPETYMGQGSLSGRVWANGGDTYGFMYGIQDASNYYRAEVNLNDGYARIMKAKDGVLSELASGPTGLRVGAWQDWRIERSGSAHQLYLSGTRVATAYDTEFASGSVALYASGMSSVYFGRPQIELPGIRPSELNVALGRSTSQSSTDYDGYSGRAVDGDTYGAYSGNSVTHTASNAGAWWRVDLGTTRNVDTVTVWNRTDCCTDRLSSFYVELLDSNGAVVTSRYYSGTQPKSQDFDMGGRAGRYVRVRLAGTNYLSLAEVQVWRTEQ